MTRVDRYLARIAELQTVAECRLATDFAARDPKLTERERDHVEAVAFARACVCVHEAAAAAIRARERAAAARVDVEMPDYMHR